MTRSWIVLTVVLVAVVVAVGVVVGVAVRQPSAQAGHCPAGQVVSYRAVDRVYVDDQGRERKHPAVISTCSEGDVNE